MSNNHLRLQFGIGLWPGTARMGWEQEGEITSWLGPKQGSRHRRERTTTAGHSTTVCRVGFGPEPCGQIWREAAPASTGQEMFVCLAGEFAKKFRHSVT